jgi:hypothetical protein
MEEDDRLGMTEEQWEWFQAATRGFGEQDDNGVDVSLIRANLLLTPTERLEQHRRALRLMLEVQHAGATRPSTSTGAARRR